MRRSQYWRIFSESDTIIQMSTTEETTATTYPQLAIPMLTRARANAVKVRSSLEKLLSERIPRYASEDTSLIVFGSLARREWTSSSDLDWTYLIDGQANSDHLAIAQQIKKILAEEDQFRAPGQSGTFGNMAFSHDIIHQIGGQFDTNKNTTQRVLLLLESDVIGKSTQAHERILKAVINRYLEEDNHRLIEDGKSYRVPRFLLNDVVRFWRTMGVDFASKQRDRGGEGWGLRNAKLRMSRKLIFASGLLVCFSCSLDPDLQKQISISTDDNAIKLNLVNHIRGYVKQTPLEIVARSLNQYSVPDLIQKQFFSSYAAFLALLDNEDSRKALKDLRAKDSRTDVTFKKVKQISSEFEEALDYIFFENEFLKPLTRKFGVF
jgi:predicted nucleotidyltransferase